MMLRKQIKQWLYGSCPGFAGAFPYYGTRVYFPKKSHIFNMACEQGIYEKENLRLISTFIKPDSVYFDIGANIGLMSIPILHNYPSCTVVSMEPSPNTLSFLTRTAENSKFGDRWRVLGKAAGSSIGSLEFFIASMELGAFDGFQDTARAGATRKVSVPVTTVDAEWEAMGKPPVSVIKIDVEGAELQTLKGAINCIKNERPYILLEWNSLNLRAHNCEPVNLLTFTESLEYQVFITLEEQGFKVPYFLPVANLNALKLQMLKTENFLLVPE